MADFKKFIDSFLDVSTVRIYVYSYTHTKVRSIYSNISIFCIYVYTVQYTRTIYTRTVYTQIFLCRVLYEYNNTKFIML